MLKVLRDGCQQRLTAVFGRGERVLLAECDVELWLAYGVVQVCTANGCSELNFLACASLKAVYHCARQLRRGLWNTSMDIPSRYSIMFFNNHELTD
ncbi:hypothetical protein CXB35_21945 [Pseudomonas syringae]|nr:hypothetical protein CXB35_21945 [Pseudomonas syringae]